MRWSFIAVLLSACLCAAPQEGQSGPERETTLPDRNPFDSSADAAIGHQYFLGHCAQCHGPHGEGGRGVNLTTGRYRHGGSDTQLYRTIRNGVPGSEMHGTHLSPPELWRVVAYVRRLGEAGAEEKATGDPAAGKSIYVGKGHCASCHMIDGSGGTLGPELSGIGLRRSLEFLKDSIVEPSAYIDRAYRSATVVTRDGRSVRGIVLNEDDYSIQIRDLAGDLRSFLKSESREVRLERESLMPSYKSSLSPAELNDLVAYLNSLRGSE